MRTLGLIGGMSWQSTIQYYRLINQIIGESLGGHHSARCLLHSVDFQEIEEAQSAGDWEKAGQILADAALSVERAGAQAIVLCTNTMHRVSQRMTRDITVPLLHIGTAVADRVARTGFRQVGLLGTRYTMEESFYNEMLPARGVEVMVPHTEHRALVHRVIYEELVFGRIETDSRDQFLEIISELQTRGAEGVILGCTEIPLLVRQEDTGVPLFDTTQIHAEEASSWALNSPS
jgi:aspartate racemase